MNKNAEALISLVLIVTMIFSISFMLNNINKNNTNVMVFGIIAGVSFILILIWGTILIRHDKNKK